MNHQDPRLQFMAFANTVKAHWSGIVQFAESRLTNGILEGINRKTQLAKRRPRGYRSINNFINMIYFLCGKLKFVRLPTVFHIEPKIFC
jgi:transposase